MKHNEIFRTIFSVTGLIVLAKILGFVKQMVVASTFGATIETDLINLSQSFVGDIEYVLIQALMTSFVAIYIYVDDQDKLRSKNFAVDTIKTFLLLAVAVMGIILIAAPWLARLIAPTYSTELSMRLAGYLRLYAPALVFFVLIAVFQALLTANKRFIPGELVGFNQSVILIAVVLLFNAQWGVKAMIVGFFAYTVYNTLYLGFLSRKSWKLLGGNPFSNPSVRELLRMIAPLMLGYSLVYVNQLVDKILVSGLDTGSVTALGYGAVLFNLVATFIVSFGSILFSYVTSCIAAQQHKRAAQIADWAAGLLVLVFLPVSILTILCSHDIVTIAFGRGAFSADGIQTAALSLTGYAFAFVPLVLREVYSRFQYGYKDSRHPMINSSIGIGTNIALSIALCPHYGVLGVTVASSISTTICGILNTITARRHNKEMTFRPWLGRLPYFLVAGVACGLAASWATGYWQASGAFLRFLMSVLCGGVAYLLPISPLLRKLLKARPVNKGNTEELPENNEHT